MKHNNYLESLKGIFGDLSSLTPEKLQEFVGATMKQLFDLKEQLESQDLKVREEGIKCATELKEVLESQLENIAKLTGEDPSQLAAMMNFPADSQEEEILSNAKEQFQYLKRSFSADNKKVNNKVNLIG